MNIQSEIKISNNGSDTLSTNSQKKILYFSDGTLEVDDIEDNMAAESESRPFPVNPQELNWVPWMWYQTVTAGSKALEVCDYLGESLASFFGITTPKYQFEINEYMRIKKAEEEEAAQNEIEMGSWTKNFDSEVSFKDTILQDKPKIQSKNDNITNI